MSILCGILNLLSFNKNAQTTHMCILKFEKHYPILFFRTLHMLFPFSGRPLPTLLIFQLKHFISNSNFPDISAQNRCPLYVFSKDSVLCLRSLSQVILKYFCVWLFGSCLAFPLNEEVLERTCLFRWLLFPGHKAWLTVGTQWVFVEWKAKRWKVWSTWHPSLGYKNDIYCSCDLNLVSVILLIHTAG